MSEPDEWRQWQTTHVYTAEECLWEEYEDTGDEALESDEVRDFIHRTMEAAGWDGDALPSLHFDIPDDDWRAGELGDDGIHLHPQLLRSSVVLHEVAHWLRPADGHGPEFCGTYIGLIRAAFGDDVGDRLGELYEELGVPVDASWA